MRNKFKNKKGFTLVELLVAVALFTTIAFFSIGAVLSIFDANRKAQSSKTVVDNLNLSLENMVRTIRFGNNYHCGTNTPLSSPRDCSTGDSFLAVTFEGFVNPIIYRWNGTINDPIQKSENGGTSYVNITAPEVKIDYLRFYVFNTSAGAPDNKQPYVIVVIKGYSGNKPTSQTKFSIQTLISQRKLDL